MTSLCYTVCYSRRAMWQQLAFSWSLRWNMTSLEPSLQSWSACGALCPCASLLPSCGVLVLCAVRFAPTRCCYCRFLSFSRSHHPRLLCALKHALARLAFAILQKTSYPSANAIDRGACERETKGKCHEVQQHALAIPFPVQSRAAMAPSATIMSCWFATSRMLSLKLQKGCVKANVHSSHLQL